MLSHYKFKEHLINKGNEYGCVVDAKVSENETTMTCTLCGCRQYTLNKRIRKCNNCKKEIDRDINASRNVIIKNVLLDNIRV